MPAYDVQRVALPRPPRHQAGWRFHTAGNRGRVGERHCQSRHRAGHAAGNISYDNVVVAVIVSRRVRQNQGRIRRPSQSRRSFPPLVTQRPAAGRADGKDRSASQQDGLVAWLPKNDGRRGVETFSGAAGVVDRKNLRGAQGVAVEGGLVDDAIEAKPAAVACRPGNREPCSQLIVISAGIAGAGQGGGPDLDPIQIDRFSAAIIRHRHMMISPVVDGKAAGDLIIGSAPEHLHKQFAVGPHVDGRHKTFGGARRRAALLPQNHPARRGLKPQLEGKGRGAGKRKQVLRKLDIAGAAIKGKTAANQGVGQRGAILQRAVVPAHDVQRVALPRPPRHQAGRRLHATGNREHQSRNGTGHAAGNISDDNVVATVVVGRRVRQSQSRVRGPSQSGPIRPPLVT